MPFISCFSYRLFHNFIFIQFEKFVKVYYNTKAIILTNEEIISNKILFQIFTISLLLTENTSAVSSVKNKNKKIYGVSTLLHWNKSNYMNYYGVIEFEKLVSKNPLNMMEPKRANSDKKKRKFFKKFNNFCKYDLIKDPITIINEFINEEKTEAFNYFKKYIHYECKINILSNILHNYGTDVYSSIIRFV
jgi:hypothetical protein